MMSEYNVYELENLSLSKPEFYKLAWGSYPASMDDHWMSWFDFENHMLHIHWHWRKLHMYQIRFVEKDNEYNAVELRTSEPPLISSAGIQHAWRMVNSLVKSVRYRIVEDN